MEGRRREGRKEAGEGGREAGRAEDQVSASPMIPQYPAAHET